MRYCIRDYRDIYDISNQEFEEPEPARVSLQDCLLEVHNAVQLELSKYNIEVSVALHDSCPKQLTI
jgi:hypothetical protein